MTQFRIGDRITGPGRPTYVIAEACVNHNGSYATALALCDAARAAGADAVKFQLHYPEHEMLAALTPPSGNFAKPLAQILAETHLTEGEHEGLRDHCRDIGIEYLCTAYCREASDTLARLGLPMFKIGSGETLNHPFLRWVAGHGAPMLVSTGMTTLDEVDATVAFLRGLRVEFALTHCTSEYPPGYEDINLGVIPVLADRYDVVVGHSDHSPDITTAVGAVALGAPIVEKHFTLSRDQEGPDHPVSIEPDELTEMIRMFRILETARGDRKDLFDREREIRAWAHHSVVTLKPVGEGDRFDESNTWVKRPGTGIPASRLPEVLGRTATRDVPADSQVAWQDLG
ncbi:N-acetylneuraminate synthase family protein [Actinomycetospora aeridis]|uniref:N-acetylneuraminate synthase family protein n=1 Tax=Actinomycetospora aeridis TaxID=3129231 RepID=A0ABU8N8E7_9PSEU